MQGNLEAPIGNRKMENQDPWNGREAALALLHDFLQLDADHFFQFNFGNIEVSLIIQFDNLRGNPGCR